QRPRRPGVHRVRAAARPRRPPLRLRRPRGQGADTRCRRRRHARVRGLQPHVQRARAGGAGRDLGPLIARDTTGRVDAPRAAGTALLAGALAAAVAIPIGATGVASAASVSSTHARWSSGAGQRAALANPSCDPETGRLRYGSRYRPPCVLEWAAGSANGGATA